jgi:hypothetical protein
MMRGISCGVRGAAGALLGMVLTCGGVSPAAGAERAASLLGVHDANLSSPGMMDMERLFAGRPGWLVNTVYSTDFDWVGVGNDFNRARDVGFTPVVRVDYTCTVTSRTLRAPRNSSSTPTGGSTSGTAAPATIPCWEECGSPGTIPSPSGKSRSRSTTSAIARRRIR